MLLGFKLAIAIPHGVPRNESHLHYESASETHNIFLHLRKLS